jgi:hypothetical protein
MKKYIFALLAMASLSLSSCETTAPEAPAPISELPTADGQLILEFTDAKLNITPTIVAAKGDAVTISLNIKKSSTGAKPRYLEFYVTSDMTKRGTRVFDPIKLKNVDEQTKTVEYTISETTGKQYLFFEVTDSDSKRTRKVVTVNISADAQVASWTDVSLGAQTNALGSRLASATGDIYAVCDLDSNITYVDITYAALGSPTANPTLLSNPQRAAKYSLSTTVPSSNTQCGGTSTGGGLPTYFMVAPTTVNFDTADDAALNALTISSATGSQDIVVSAGKTYAFLNGRSKKGLIRVKTLEAGVAGKITFDIKVQK